jgi:hypothetical protein
MKLLIGRKQLYLPVMLLAGLLTLSGCNKNDKNQPPLTAASPVSASKDTVKQTALSSPEQQAPGVASTSSLKTSTTKTTNQPEQQNQEQQNQQTIAQSPVLKDTLIVPGERVGAVTPKTTKQDLVKLFGESSLKDKTISGPEGIGTFAATEVNLGADKSFLVVWSDDTRTKILDVRNLGSAWKTPEGIGVGTSFKQLRRTLGEFKLTGLGWDYGGYVNFQGTKLSRYRGKLVLGVDADENLAQKFPKDLQAVSGDQQLSSNNPHWKPLGMRVTRMVVVFSQPAQ